MPRENRRRKKRLRREARVRRIKDIFWSALIASVITIIVVTALGWLTTQAVVETARRKRGRSGTLRNARKIGPPVVLEEGRQRDGRGVGI